MTTSVLASTPSWPRRPSYADITRAGRGDTATATMPGPTCAPTTAPTSLTRTRESSRRATQLGRRGRSARVGGVEVVHGDVARTSGGALDHELLEPRERAASSCAPSPAGRPGRRRARGSASPRAPARAAPAPRRSGRRGGGSRGCRRRTAPMPSPMRLADDVGHLVARLRRPRLRERRRAPRSPSPSRRVRESTTTHRDRRLARGERGGVERAATCRRTGAPRPPRSRRLPRRRRTRWAKRSGEGREVVTTLQRRSAAATSAGVISVPSSYGLAVDDDLHGHDADAVRGDEVRGQVGRRVGDDRYACSMPPTLAIAPARARRFRPGRC